MCYIPIWIINGNVKIDKNNMYSDNGPGMVYLGGGGLKHLGITCQRLLSCFVL